MEKILHRAEKRGKGEYGWLSTHYSFSFANWYEPSRMGFGALRVLNDDTIAPASGFPMHSHRDMEIITIVTEGTLTHKDSLGNTDTVKAGEVQVMSAGTGITHSEYNASATEPLTLFQLWILPEQPGGDPRYEQSSFQKTANGFMPLVGPLGTPDVLGIRANARIHRASLTSGMHIYRLTDPAHGIYVFVIDGKVSVAGEALGARDAIGISGTSEVSIESADTADLLLIEVPL